MRKWLLGAAGLAVLGAASPALAAPAPAPAVVTAWQTCVPRATDYITQPSGFGKIGWRVDNDLFAGMAGRLCVTAKTGPAGAGLVVTTNVPADRDGTVVAAPDVETGPWYGQKDRNSPFPVSIWRLAGIRLHLYVQALGGGTVLADADTYAYTSRAAVRGNPGTEMVIGVRWRHYYPKGSLVHLAGHWWRVAPWISGSRTPMGSHRIIVYTLVHQDPRVTVPLEPFVRYARRMGWWPRHDTIIGNTRIQGEIWKGGKGMRLWLNVTTPMPVPQLSLAPVKVLAPVKPKP